MKRMLAIAVIVSAMTVLSDTLTWNGGTTGVWDTTTKNWLNSGNEACAWADGSVAAFPAGVNVDVQDAFEAAGLVFSGDAILAGGGFINLSDAAPITVPGGATVGMAVNANGAVTVDGAGTLYANSLYGTAAVSNGALMVGGFHTYDRLAVTTSGNGTVTWLVGDTAGANLIANGSFEDGVTTAKYTYVNNDSMPTSWINNDTTKNFVILATGGMGDWSNTGVGGTASIPDGLYVAGLQYDGHIEQNISVTTAGFYDLSMVMFKRTNYGAEINDSMLKVSLDGVQQTKFFNPYRSGTWRTVNSGPIYFSAGSHTLRMEGIGHWGDVTVFIDNLKLLPCTATTPTRMNNESAFGNGVTGLNSVNTIAPDDGGISYFTKVLGGDYAMTPTFGSNVMVTVESGELDFSNITLSEPAKLHKFGRGTLHLTEGMGPLRTMALWEGELKITTDAIISFCAHTFGTPAQLTMDLTGDITMNDSPELFGDAPVTIATTGNGHKWSLNGSLRSSVPVVTFDIGEGDYAGSSSLIQTSYNSQLFATDMVKTGAGTYYFSNSDANTLNGTVFLRNGTLELNANDLTYGSTHPITGATAGYPILGNAVAKAVQIADENTPADAAITLKLNGTNLATARTLNIGSGGATVALATSGNRQGFLGGINLARPATKVVSPIDATIEFNAISRAEGYTGTVTLDGTGAGTLALNHDIGAGVAIVSDCGVNLGTGYQLAVAMDELTLSGTTTIGFGTAGYDTFNVGTLTLGELTVTLANDVTGGVFAEVGSYTIFTYTTFNGNVASLNVAADSKVEGFAYTFRDTGSAIVLDITATEGSAYYNWITQGGAWAATANWSPSQVPNAIGLTVRFGGSATEAATVTLEDTYALTAMQFANANGYTLNGGKLQFGSDGVNPPSISAEFGTHTIKSEIAASGDTAIKVNTADGAKVVFDGAVSAPVEVDSGTIGIGNGAKVNAALTVGENSSLAVDSDTKLDGTGTVTVNGAITGSGKLTKTGTSTFALDGSDTSAFSGTLAVESGTLQTGYPTFNGTVELGSDATLTADNTIHGLLGTFYQVSNNNLIPTYAFSSAAFKSAISGKTVIAQEIIAGGNNGFDIADTDSNPATLPANLRNSGGNTSQYNFWLGAFEGVMTVPTAGLYRFQLQADDGAVWAIDGRDFIVITNVNTTANSIYLEKGPHSVYIGLAEVSGNAYAHITMIAPGETTARMIPNEWLTPYGFGAKLVHGNGKLAPPSGTAMYVASSQSGYNTAFTGTLAGGNTGTLFVGMTGGGDFSISSYLSGYLYSHLGEVALTAPGANVDVLATDNAGTTGLTGAKSVRALYGNNGKIALGAHLFNRAVTGDADCGISPYKTYTHLLKFPVTKSAVVNGVTFNQMGMDSYTISPMLPSSHDGVAGTGVRSLFAGFHYNQQTFEITLSGLIPGATYEFRNYHMAWNSDTSTAAKKRPVTFTFIADGRELDSYTSNLDTAYGASRSIGVLGCRYQAGSDGKVTVRYHSLYTSDTTHLYAISNELLNQEPAEDAITLSPDAGERASYTGQLVGSSKVTIDTDGEQAFAGTVNLPDPIELKKGTLILQRGANVVKGVNMADGTTLEMRGGSTVNTLTGTGTVVLPFGDANIYGAVQADGTFAAQDSWRVVKFSGDADCGVSPSKNYKAVVSYRSGATFLTTPIVNEVFFRESSVGTFRYDQTGLLLENLPATTHGGNNSTGVGSDQQIEKVLHAMCYAGGKGGQTMVAALKGLTAGTTYELRFYSRNWSSGGTRNVTIAFDPNGGDTPTESHTINIDAVENHPCYFGFRFKAAGPEYKFTHLSPDNSNTWHMYGLSLEAVEDAGNVRTFNIAEDQSYDGTVSGIGIVNKTGAGNLTLNGLVSATGFWTVSNGGLTLTEETSSLYKLSVKDGATFGGVGTITGTAGFASGSTLELGVPGAPGTLTLAADDNVLANGAKLRVNHTANDTSTLTVGDIALPDQLAVTMVPDTAGVKLFGNRVLIQSANGFYNPPDLSNWTVVDEAGEAINGMDIHYSNDAKAIMISGTSGTLIMLL